jgi:hypothetical protein
MKQTHLNYVKQVAGLARDRLPADEQSKLDAQLSYSLGRPGLRGVTYYSQWQNGGTDPVPFIEVCALGEENDIQLAATTIHELGHVLAGHGAGHGPDWKQACDRLGLRRAKMHQSYRMAQFEPSLRAQIAALISPTDGKPIGNRAGLIGAAGRCPAGLGTRGGKSRGAGSGSRMRKFTCQCSPPVIVRSARDELRATCMDCGSQFTQT